MKKIFENGAMFFAFALFFVSFSTFVSAYCTGSPKPCSYWSHSFHCRAAGCIWDYDYCTGTPNSCSTYSNESSCRTAGCTWLGATQTPRPSNCYSWAYQCESANSSRCSCYDAVNCKYNWDHDCYTFWYCDNSKCSKPAGCYDYYEICYIQNASKCTCKEAVKCKYNSTYDCYSFDYCDTSLCPPAGCMKSHLDCINSYASSCSCKEAVNCLYHSLYDCYTFQDCNNSRCPEAEVSVKDSPVCVLSHSAKTSTVSVKPGERLSASAYIYCEASVDSVTISMGSQSRTCNPSYAGSNCILDYSEVIPASKQPGTYTIPISATVRKAGVSLSYSESFTYKVLDDFPECVLSAYSETAVNVSVRPGKHLSATATLNCRSNVDSISISFGGKTKSCGGAGFGLSCSVDYSELIPADRKPGKYTIPVKATATKAGKSVDYTLSFEYSVIEPPDIVCDIRFNPATASLYPGSKIDVTASVNCNKEAGSIAIRFGDKENRCSFSQSCSVNYTVVGEGLPYTTWNVYASAQVTVSGITKSYNSQFSYTVYAMPSCSIKFSPSPATVKSGDVLYASATLECDGTMDRLNVVFGGVSNYCSYSKGCMASINIPTTGKRPGSYSVDASGSAVFKESSKTYSGTFTYTITDKPTTSSSSTATPSTSAQSTQNAFEQIITVIRETLRLLFPFG